jgi:hypothetical protein
MSFSFNQRHFWFVSQREFRRLKVGFQLVMVWYIQNALSTSLVEFAQRLQSLKTYFQPPKFPLRDITHIVFSKMVEILFLNALVIISAVCYITEAFRIFQEVCFKRYSSVWLFYCIQGMKASFWSLIFSQPKSFFVTNLVALKRAVG